MELLTALLGDISLWNCLTERFHREVAVGVWFKDDDWTGGIWLQPQTLRMLGERGLALDFDMYATGASN